MLFYDHQLTKLSIDNVATGWRGAMKKIVMIAAALAVVAMPAGAADLLVKARAPAPIPVWSWTGFYIGGNVGGAWAKSDWLEDPSLSGAGGPFPGFVDASINPASFVGGGQVGFDYQTGRTVFGVQADADLTDNLKSTAGCFPQFAGDSFTCMTNIKSIGTVTGRVGAAFDRTLLYVLGGIAWEREQLDNACPACNAGAPILFRAETTRNGWTVGAGVEYALAGNWSAFLQYNYMGFGTRDLQFTTLLSDGLSPFTEDIRDHINVVKAGINYRFH
jgi:outer membrane immunogenic protein